MSLKSVELWRPRRERGRAVRSMFAGASILALVVGSPVAALLLHRVVILFAGLGLAVLAAIVMRPPRAPDRWSARRPRPWVPRRAEDRRTGAGPDRRKRTAA